MTDYKPTNAEIVHCLKAAKNCLSYDGDIICGYHKFICNAVSYASLYNDVSKYVVEKIIAERLDGESTLCNWLIEQGIPMRELTDSNLQTHRHEWLDMLIKEFSV